MLMASELTEYSSDFTFLQELKAFAKTYLEGELSSTESGQLKNGIYSNLEDGRCIRIVIPDIPRAKTRDLDHAFFVGFIGNVDKSRVKSELIDRTWNIDQKLVEELSLHDDIVAYISAERFKGGDWGNLVLTNSLNVIEDWRRGSAHQTAVQYVFSFFGMYKKKRKLIHILKINTIMREV